MFVVWDQTRRSVKLKQNKVVVWGQNLGASKFYPKSLFAWSYLYDEMYYLTTYHIIRFVVHLIWNEEVQLCEYRTHESISAGECIKERALSPSS